jgi:hypothetical protein
MSSLAAQAREEIAAAISLAVPDIPVAAMLPPTITPPLIALRPGSPYMTPSTLGSQLRYRLSLVLVVMLPTTDLVAGVARLEAVVEAILPALAGLQVGELQAPRVEDIGAQGSVVLAELDLNAQIER